MNTQLTHKRLFAAFATVMCLGGPWTAQATAIVNDNFTVDVTVQQGDGSVRTAFNFLLNPGLNRGLTGGGDLCNNDGLFIGSCDASARLASFNFSVDVETDPSIIYAVGFTNLTAVPSNLIIGFSSPYLGGPYNSLDATIAAPQGDATSVVADSFIDGAIKDTLNCGSTQQSACNLSHLGVGVSTPVSGNFGPHFTISLPAANPLTGTSSQTANGTEILSNQITLPEPATLSLLAVGALGVGWRRRK